jgi:hypothetical protein
MIPVNRQRKDKVYYVAVVLKDLGFLVDRDRVSSPFHRITHLEEPRSFEVSSDLVI